MIPYHDFVHVVERYRVQLHELTLTAFAHLSKFVRAMVSYRGSPDIKVFTRPFVLHYQSRRAKPNGVDHDCNYGLYSFTPRRGENYSIMHYNKSKRSHGWVEN